jgi:hypothetical protein
MQAKAQYEKILGKALRGYGPSEHWAHAEYARLLYEDGDRTGALEHMKMAFDVASLPDTKSEPSELASYSFQLGRMLWEQPEAKECAPMRSQACRDSRGSGTPYTHGVK